MPEKFDAPDVVNEKSRLLGEMIQSSKHVVVITGAGVSTSAGIPDFRGPSGTFIMTYCCNYWCWCQYVGRYT